MTDIKHGTVFISDSGGIHYYDESMADRTPNAIPLIHLFVNTISYMNKCNLSSYVQLDATQSMQLLSNYGKWKKQSAEYEVQMGANLINISNNIDCIVDSE